MNFRLPVRTVRFLMVHWPFRVEVRGSGFRVGLKFAGQGLGFRSGFRF